MKRVSPRVLRSLVVLTETTPTPSIRNHHQTRSHRACDESGESVELPIVAADGTCECALPSLGADLSTQDEGD